MRLWHICSFKCASHLNSALLNHAFCLPFNFIWIRSNIYGFYLIWLLVQITLLRMVHTSKSGRQTAHYFNLKSRLYVGCLIVLTALWLLSLIRYVFSTEGHLLPATPQISLVREHCSYLGAYCRSGDSRRKSFTSDTSYGEQKNYTKEYGSRTHTYLPSETSYASAPFSGFIKVGAHPYC